MLIFKLNLGDSQLICKSIGMLQGISIFVSLLAVQIEFDLLEKFAGFNNFHHSDSTRSISREWATNPIMALTFVQFNQTSKD